MNRIKIILLIFIQEAQSYCPEVIYFRTNIDDPDQLHAFRKGFLSKWTATWLIYLYRLYHSYQEDDKPTNDEWTTLTSKLIILLKTWVSRDLFVGSRPRTRKSSTGKMASYIIDLDLHTRRIFLVTAKWQGRVRHLFPGKKDVLASIIQNAFAAGKSFMKSQVRPRARNCGAIAATCCTTASTLPLAEAAFKIESESSIK